MKPIHDFFALKASFAKLLRLQKLPFRITPQIERYLEDILYLHDKWLANNKDDVLYLIGIELKDEPVLPDSKENNDRFWKYLQENRLAIALPHMWAEDGFSITVSKLDGGFPSDLKEREDFFEHLEENMTIEIPDIWDRRVNKIMARTSPSELVAIARTYAEKGSPVQKFFAEPQHR